MHYMDLEVKTREKQQKMHFLITDLGDNDLILGYPCVTTYDDVQFFFHFYLLFIMCTFTVGHMTDDLPLLTRLTWSHTLLSHVTHHLMTQVDSG